MVPFEEMVPKELNTSHEASPCKGSTTSQNTLGTKSHSPLEDCLDPNYSRMFMRCFQSPCSFATLTLCKGAFSSSGRSLLSRSQNDPTIFLSWAAFSIQGKHPQLPHSEKIWQHTRSFQGTLRPRQLLLARLTSVSRSLLLSTKEIGCQALQNGPRLAGRRWQFLQHSHQTIALSLKK